MINRENMLENMKQEQRLRKLIRRDLKLFLEKKAKENNSKSLNEEKRLRQLLRQLINEAAGKTDVPDAQPHQNTGINVLEELLKTIVPIVETGYKSLTSNVEQRTSFRAHILNAVENTLRPVDVVSDLPHKPSDELQEQEDEDLTLKISDDDEKFIPVRQQDIEPEEPEEEDTFSIEGEDLTGRNFASVTFNKVENQILDSYESLANKEDRDLFYDYLLTNLKLYFDKFEDELKANVAEPESPDYQPDEQLEENN